MDGPWDEGPQAPGQVGLVLSGEVGPGEVPGAIGIEEPWRGAGGRGLLCPPREEGVGEGGSGGDA